MIPKYLLLIAGGSDFPFNLSVRENEPSSAIMLKISLKRKKKSNYQVMFSAKL